MSERYEYSVTSGRFTVLYPGLVSVKNLSWMSFLARTGFVHLVKTWLEGNSVFVNIGVLLRTSELAFTASERTYGSAI